MDDAEARLAIAEHLGVPVALVVDGADFRDLGADSLDLIELSVALEQQFDLRLPDDEVEHCTTIGDAILLLRRASSLGAAAVAPEDLAVEYGEASLDVPPLAMGGRR